MLKKIILHPFFLFPFLTCVFFWPLSLQLFTFKNDALTYYYPVRSLISDALHNHELPLWTPFINMGYPLHADMQSGAWNPLIWLIGFATNYGLAAFHYEVLLYLAIGGIGFYYLGRDYGWNKYTALIIALAYEFSGPLIDSIQFTACISAACYIPFIFLFFRRLLQYKQPANNALLSGLFLYLLFTGGYPAFFIIILYLLISFFLFAFFSLSGKKAFLKKIIFPLLLFAVTFSLLSLPAILSFINHLPFIDRGKKQGLDFVLENSMPPSCMFSLLGPFSTTASNSFFNTNPLMRNIYMGLIPLVFLVHGLLNKTLIKNKQLLFFLITALILFGLAWGNHFFLRQIAYYVLPLMDTFRHPALFRFFGVIFLLLAAGFAINENIGSSNNTLLKKIILITVVLVIVICALCMLFPSGTLLPAHLDTGQLKNFVTSLGFQQRFLIQSPFIIIILFLFYRVIVKKNTLPFLMLLSVTDLFFAVQLNMPITVIGANGFASARQYINRNEMRFPLPANETIEENVLHSFDSSNIIGSRLPFEKKIGRNDYFITPGNLSLQEKFYESDIREPVFKNRVAYFADTVYRGGYGAAANQFNKLSFAFIDPGTAVVNGEYFPADTILIKKLSANGFKCITQTTQLRLLVFLQNMYPGWAVFVDGRKSPLFTTNITFMGVNVPAGEHTIVFRYHPALIIYSWYISLTAFFILIFFLLYSISRQRAFLKQH